MSLARYYTQCASIIRKIEVKTPRSHNFQPREFLNDAGRVTISKLHWAILETKARSVHADRVDLHSVMILNLRHEPYRIVSRASHARRSLITLTG